MAHVRKGHLVPAPQWWKHLDKYWSRKFWKAHRRAEQREVDHQVAVNRIVKASLKRAARSGEFDEVFKKYSR